MNREDVIRMAKEAGCVRSNHVLNPWSVSTEELERFAALVAAEKKQQMIRDGYRKCAEGQRTTQFCGLLDAAVKAEREKVAAWMRARSYATGHGDTVEDLLKELEWQVAEREREACAKACDARVIGDHNREDQEAKRCAAAIRARGEA